jgi:hypothetical protein
MRNTETSVKAGTAAKARTLANASNSEDASKGKDTGNSIGTPAKQEYQEQQGRHQQLRQPKHKVRQGNVDTSYSNTAVRELSVWVCTEFTVTQT